MQVNNITPESVKKAVRDLIQTEQAAEAKVEYEVKRRPNLKPAEIKAKVASWRRDVEGRLRVGVREGRRATG